MLQRTCYMLNVPMIRTTTLQIQILSITLIYELLGQVKKIKNLVTLAHILDIPKHT